MVKKERMHNVSGIKAEGEVLKALVNLVGDGQITLTVVNTDDTRSVTFAVASPLDVNIVSPDPLPTIAEDADGDIQKISTQGSAQVELYDGASGPAALDNSTWAQTCIDYVHHETHGGSAYNYTHYQTVAAAATVYYMIETPAGTEEQHLIWEINGTAITTAILYEDGDRVGDNDVTTSVFNKNRRSGNTTDIVLDDAITGGTTDGNRIWGASGGTAQGNFKGVASMTARGEWILEESTKYLFAILSGTNGNVINIDLDFYEHTPKE